MTTLLMVLAMFGMADISSLKEKEIDMLSRIATSHLTVGKPTLLRLQPQIKSKKIIWGSSNITITNNNAIGLIYSANKIYSIEPLGRGYHVLTEIDQTKIEDK